MYKVVLSSKGSLLYTCKSPTSTKCGFGAKEKVTPKKNYQEFYTKVDTSFLCNRCDFKIEYLQGIHRHLRTCCGLPGAIDNLGGGEPVHKEEELAPGDQSEENFFGTNMNYIGHDETL